MRSQDARRQLSATEARNLRRLLLLNVFEPESIGERIKQAREQAGLRQEDLADLLGVATRTVQNYEGAATKPFKQLNAIAAATGTTTEWLLHGDSSSGEDGDGTAGVASIDHRLEELAAAVRDLTTGQETILDRLDTLRAELQAAREPRRARPRRSTAG